MLLFRFTYFINVQLNYQCQVQSCLTISPSLRVHINCFILSLSLCPFCFVLLYSLRLHVGTSLTLFCLCFSIFLSLYLSFPAYSYLAHLISQSALSANVYRPVIGTKGKIKADGTSKVSTYSIYVHTYIRCIHSYFIHKHTHTQRPVLPQPWNFHTYIQIQASCSSYILWSTGESLANLSYISYPSHWWNLLFNNPYIFCKNICTSNICQPICFYFVPSTVCKIN